MFLSKYAGGFLTFWQYNFCKKTADSVRNKKVGYLEMGGREESRNENDEERHNKDSNSREETQYQIGSISHFSGMCKRVPEKVRVISCVWSRDPDIGI